MARFRRRSARRPHRAHPRAGALHRGLAGLAFAGAELLGGNGFITAFVAGLTLGNTQRELCTRVHEFGEAEGQLLTLVVFLIVGAVLVPEALPLWDHRAWLYALSSLTVVRMAPVALSLAGTRLRPATLAFVGWFGPRGLASILYARIVVGEGLPVAGLRSRRSPSPSCSAPSCTASPRTRWRAATESGWAPRVTGPERITAVCPSSRCASATPGAAAELARGACR